MSLKGPYDGSNFCYTGPTSEYLSNFAGQHSMNPITTGTTVMAVEYEHGVMMAADKLASYGSLARFHDVPRLYSPSRYVLLGYSGDCADFQCLSEVMQRHTVAEHETGLGVVTRASHVHSWLSRVLYNRRSRMNPLWTSILVAGLEQDQTPYLGYVDKLGTAYRTRAMATGMGMYLALPLLRRAIEGDGVGDGCAVPTSRAVLDYESAKKLLQDCLNVCYKRDCRASTRYQLGTVTAEGVTIIDDLKLDVDWGLADFYTLSSSSC